MLGVFLNARKIERKKRLKRDGPDQNRKIRLFLYWNSNLCIMIIEIYQTIPVIHIEERSVWNLFMRKILLEDIDLTIYPSRNGTCPWRIRCG